MPEPLPSPQQDARTAGAVEHPAGAPPADALTVDCDGCIARGPACTDCVVTVLLGPPRPRLELDPEEVTALDTLAAAGLVPPLRLVRAVDPAAEEVGPDAALRCEDV